MAVTIKLFEFTLVVTGKDRTTVLFPAEQHSLVLMLNGRPYPVPKGSNLEIRATGGHALPGGKAQIDPSFSEQVPEINDVEGGGYSVPADTIDPAKAPIASLNAKLHFSGGTLSATECSIKKYANKPFKFKTKGHFATDTIVVSLPGDHYALYNNGKGVPVALFTSNDTIQFNNADLLGAKEADFANLGEYVKILESVFGVTVPTPVATDDLHFEGLDNVCADAWIDVP